MLFHGALRPRSGAPRDHGIRVMKDAMSREIIEALDEAGIGIASATFEIVGVPPLHLKPADAAWPPSPGSCVPLPTARTQGIVPAADRCRLPHPVVGRRLCPRPSDPWPSPWTCDFPRPVGMVFASQSSRTREDSHTIRSRAEIRMRITVVLKGLCLLAVAGLFAGCNGTAEDHQSPAQAAQEALKVEGNGQQKTVESQRDVEVVKTTKVIDQKTGEVITTNQEVTPVTVQKTKEIDTQVKEGQTTRTVK